MRSTSSARLQAQDVGMAADRARRRAGRIEHDHVEGPPRRPGRRIGLHHLGGELQAGQVLAQAIEARGRHVDGRDLGAGRGQTRGFATRRRAQIGHRLARHVAGNARDQRRGRVLHPPRALGVAGQVLDAAVGGEPDRAGGQQPAAEPLRPRCRAYRARLYADVESGLASGSPRRCGVPPQRRRPCSSAATANRGR